MTEYLVLRHQHPNPNHWEELGYEVARSSSAAIRAYLETAPAHEQADGGGEFVAVPARSWKPVTVKVETKTALRFS